VSTQPMYLSGHIHHWLPMPYCPDGDSWIPMAVAHSYCYKLSISDNQYYALSIIIIICTNFSLKYIALFTSITTPLLLRTLCNMKGWTKPYSCLRRPCKTKTKKLCTWIRLCGQTSIQGSPAHDYIHVHRFCKVNANYCIRKAVNILMEDFKSGENIYPLSTWLINVPLILSGNWISQLYMLHLDCLKLRGAVILLIKRANIIPAISYSLNYIGLAVSKLLGLSLLVPAVLSQCHVQYVGL